MHENMYCAKTSTFTVVVGRKIGKQFKSTCWGYYHISNAMQYSNTALETTTLVIYDPNRVFYVVFLFLMALGISLTYITYHKYDKHY